jgi:hypothetical protein
MSRVENKREVARTVRILREQGWLVQLTKSGHWRCAAPDGGSVNISATPRNNRTILNDRTRLKRRGAHL